MIQDTPARPDAQAYDTTIVHAQPAAAIEAETPEATNRGHFRKGHDPRRHKLSSEECSRGFWRAVESIVERYPDAVMRDGRHMVCNFLRSRKEVAA